jgi:hypothetical protein
MARFTKSFQSISLAAALFAVAAFGLGLLCGLKFGEEVVVINANPELDRAWWMLERDDLQRYVSDAVMSADKLVVTADFPNGDERSVLIDSNSELRTLGRSFQLTSDVRPYGIPTFGGAYYYLDIYGPQRVRLMVFLDWATFGPWGDGVRPDDAYDRWWRLAQVDATFVKSIEAAVANERERSVPIK